VAVQMHLHTGQAKCQGVGGGWERVEGHIRRFSLDTVSFDPRRAKSGAKAAQKRRERGANHWGLGTPLSSVLSASLACI